MKLSAFGAPTLFLATLLLLGACKKDEVTFKDQLIGEWESTEVLVNDVNLSGTNRFTLTLEATYEFDLKLVTTISGSPATVNSNGDWMEDAVKQDITLTYTGSGSVVTYDVKEIDDTQMLVEYTQDGALYTIRFKRLL